MMRNGMVRIEVGGVQVERSGQRAPRGYANAAAGVCVAAVVAHLDSGSFFAGTARAFADMGMTISRASAEMVETARRVGRLILDGRVVRVNGQNKQLDASPKRVVPSPFGGRGV
jgi:hypothetical protein